VTGRTWLRSRFAAIGAGLLRARPLARAPIRLYEAGAGPMLGSRLLMLEHVGRRSSVRRTVVLEVVGHPTPDAYLVASGFGDKAQWFRNIKINPRVHVNVGNHRSSPATARVVSQQEADRALSAYISQHPGAWKHLRPVLERALGRPITETDTALPVVELLLD
jgi:deazaflavin-dependent oxidoreductase (nitroreductase family)